MRAAPAVFRRGRPWRCLARLLGQESGVSAVEFALLAPVLVLMAVATADAGMAIYQKMMLEQALRAGAQVALLGGDLDGIRAVLEEVARENFTLADGTDGGAGGDALLVDVAHYCGCPGDTIVQVSCTGVCASGLPPAGFYELSASKTFDGLMLPAFTLSGTLDVLAQ